MKKGGEKITRDIGSIGGTKAAGRLNVDPELIKQFPGVNIRKLAYPDYKANRNPKLAIFDAEPFHECLVCPPPCSIITIGFLTSPHSVATIFLFFVIL